MTRATAGERASVAILVLAISAMAVAYASAFLPAGSPLWAPWILALAIPVVTTAVMVIGARRAGAPVGRLGLLFVLVGVLLAAGFSFALVFAGEPAPGDRLWLGLPLGAAIVVYGVGLLPIGLLPVAYAMTFRSQTLEEADADRVRQLGAEFAASHERGQGE